MTDNKELDELLTRLYIKLEALKAEGTDTNELAHIVTEISYQIEQHKTEIATDVSLINNLQAKIEKVEAEHPKVTRILNDIMMKLSSIGI